MRTLKRGELSLWGEIQTIGQIGPGWYWVSTAGHGGYMVAQDLAESLLPAWALKDRPQFWADPLGYWLCFEEDCAAIVFELLVLEAGHLGPYIPRLKMVFRDWSAETVRKDGDQMVKQFYPTLWAHRQGSIRHSDFAELDTDAAGMCFSDADPGL